MLVKEVGDANSEQFQFVDVATDQINRSFDRHLEELPVRKFFTLLDEIFS